MRLTGTGRGLTASVTALAVVAAGASAGWAAGVNGTQEAVVLTSAWTPPSPDPSGIAFQPSTGDFIVSDSEVNEMPLYAGANLFATNRSGVQRTPNGTGNTLDFSNEPTGVALDGNRLFVSDDDKKSVFQIASPGGDGMYGTNDDGARTSFKTSSFGNTDPEDVAYDSKRNQLLLIDGVGGKWFKLKPGPNGTFDGVYPSGDDVATQYDLKHVGAEDPEGIAYDAVRDTVVVVDGSADLIFELDDNGSVLNTIDIKGIGITKAAGIALAPASAGSGRHYYIVDRGLDNNSHPDENDGKIFEVSATLPAITNRPPAAHAGGDQLIDVTETTTLTGAGVDSDTPANQLSFAWTQTSGPGAVTFGSAGAATTTAKFSQPGTYVLRLTVSDGQFADFDEVTVGVFEPGAERSVALPIVSGSDDAQEGGGSGGKFVDLASADNELGNAGNYDVVTGLRFANVPVPRGSEIVSAKIQFRTDEAGSVSTNLAIRGIADDNTPTFLSNSGNISSRPTTAGKVDWSVPAWSVIGEEGPKQLTPELKTLVQAVVDRPGWLKNNAVAFVIDGSGRRTAEAKDGLTPPVLKLTFKTPAVKPLSMAASTGMLKSGKRVVLTGTSSAPTVELQVRRGGGAWEILGTQVPDATGVFSMVDRPLVNSRYRAVAGTEQSTVSLVKVRPGLRAWVKHSAVRSGSPTVVGGKVMPALAGQPLVLQRLAGSQWRAMKRQTMSSDGALTYRFKVVPRGTGTKHYRVVAPPYGSRARAVAPGAAGGLAVDVYRGAIRRVNARNNVVVLRNTGAVAVNLKGWKVSNASSGKTRRIRSFALLPGRIVRLHGGRGRSDANDLFLGRPLVFWPGSTAEIHDRRGYLIDRH